MTDTPVNYFYYIRIPESTYHAVFDNTSARMKNAETDFIGERPIACVCVSYFPGRDRYVRGVSICSPIDSFVKRIGRAKASAYANSFARKAIDGSLSKPYSVTTRANSRTLRTMLDLIQDDTDLNLWMEDGKRFAKATFNLKREDLTPYEQRLTQDRPEAVSR